MLLKEIKAAFLNANKKEHIQPSCALVGEKKVSSNHIFPCYRSFTTNNSIDKVCQH